MGARLPFASATFVGRATELQRLEEGLSRVVAGAICGAAGVGKTSLAHAVAARWPGDCVAVRVHSDTPLAAAVDDARRQLAKGPVPQATSDAERLEDFGDRLEQQRGLCIFDDADRLPRDARELLLSTLSPRLEHGRVLFTSRELLGAQHSAVDILEIRLAGLDEQNARVLWAALDELYGPSEGFDVAMKRAQGSPLLLRRAHAGELGDDDPWVEAVRSLSPPERAIAGALALSAVRLPGKVVRALSQGAESGALRSLVTRMIVEVDGAGRCTIHDLFRDRVLDALGLEERAALCGRLAELLKDAELDPVVRVREVCRQLAAAQQFESSGRYLCEQAAALIRQGAAGELLKALEAIPPVLRSTAVELTRARAQVRVLDLRGAYEVLSRLEAGSASLTSEIRSVKGQVALMLAETEAAQEAFSKALEEPTLNPRVRIRAVAGLALSRAQKGDTEGALSLLALEEARAADPTAQGVLTGYRALALLLQGRSAEAEELIPRIAALLPEHASLIRDTAAPLLFGAIYARRGRLEQAQEQVERVEKALARGEDLLARMYMRLVRASCSFQRGERLEALEEFRELQAINERCGFVVIDGPCQVFMARILFQLGRRQQAEELLAVLEGRAHTLRLGSALGMASRSRGFDILRELDVPPRPPRDLRGERARARALEALRAAAAGEREHVERLAQANLVDASGPGYGLERACVTVARSILERLQGNDAAADQAWQRAEQQAAQDGVDAGLLAAIAAKVGQFRTVTGARQARLVADGAAALAGQEVVVDARSHQLCFPTSTIPLEKRPVLRKLLYAMAQRPNVRVPNEELASAIWHRPYNRRMDENALRVNIKNLRTLLSGTPLSVKLEDDGYSLSVPASFVFIDQLKPG
jgi:tetratricopeptide (TPR) repeat protein